MKKKICIADSSSSHNRQEIAYPDMKIFNAFVLRGVPEATPTVDETCGFTLTVMEFNNKTLTIIKTVTE